MGEKGTNFNIGELYRNLLPRLKVLEKERIELSKKLDKLKKFSILGSAVVVVILFPWLGIMSPIFFGAVGIAVYAVLYHRMKKNYRQGYKDKVFNELVDELGDDYSYLPNGTIDEQEYVKSGLFHPFTKIQSEDLITGKTDSHQFQMVESTLMWHKKSKDIEKAGSTSMIFKGLFFTGEISMSFPTKIWILSNNAQVVHTKSRIDTSWQKVLLDHQTFNKEYCAYTENAEMASQLLHTSILDTILEVKNDLVEDKMCMELSFQDNLVFISISSVKDLFEPPLNVPVTDFDTFKANFNYLVGTTGLLQKLTIVKSNA